MPGFLEPRDHIWYKSGLWKVFFFQGKSTFTTASTTDPGCSDWTSRRRQNSHCIADVTPPSYSRLREKCSLTVSLMMCSCGHSRGFNKSWSFGYQLPYHTMEESFENLAVHQAFGTSCDKPGHIGASGEIPPACTTCSFYLEACVSCNRWSIQVDASNTRGRSQWHTLALQHVGLPDLFPARHPHGCDWLKTHGPPLAYQEQDGVHLLQLC